MKSREFRITVALALLAVVSTVGATSPNEARKQVELSMVVKGSIDIGVNGNVEGYKVEQSEKLPPLVLDLIGKQVPLWKFEPVQVDGKPVHARTLMSLRIVAKQKDADHAEIDIQSADFHGGQDDEAHGMGIRNRTSLVPLMETMMNSGATGDVYLALKIGPDGKVMDAIVEQVNLTATGTDAEMAQARKLLGDSTVKVVRKWTFRVPTSGEEAGKPYWIGVLPVSFEFVGDHKTKYGQWKAYLPGPCTPVPWPDTDGDTQEPSVCNSGAAPEGVLTLDNSGPKLLTPLTQG